MMKKILPWIDWVLLILLWLSFLFATLMKGTNTIGWLLVNIFATYVVIKAKAKEVK